MMDINDMFIVYIKTNIFTNYLGKPILKLFFNKSIKKPSHS